MNLCCAGALYPQINEGHTSYLTGLPIRAINYVSHSNVYQNPYKSWKLKDN
jgi:hypothetical protein